MTSDFTDNRGVLASLKNPGEAGRARNGGSEFFRQDKPSQDETSRLAMTGRCMDSRLVDIRVPSDCWPFAETAQMDSQDKITAQELHRGIFGAERFLA
jgi:hypothetical protein